MSTDRDDAPATFQLGLFVGSSAFIITVGDFLALDPVSRADVDVDPSAACISLTVDGDEHWGSQLSFGALGLLVDQCPAARDRLQRGDRALIRAGGFDGPVNEYVLLDPDGDDLRATIMANDDEAVWLWMPNGDHEAELYTYVDEHLDAMREMGEQMRGIAAATVLTAAVIRDLELAAALGAEVVDLIGRGSA